MPPIGTLYIWDVDVVARYLLNNLPPRSSVVTEPNTWWTLYPQLMIKHVSNLHMFITILRYN